MRQYTFIMTLICVFVRDKYLKLGLPGLLCAHQPDHQLHYPVEGERGHLVPMALEIDVSSLFVDAHGKVGIVHSQGCLHRRLPS